MSHTIEIPFENRLRLGLSTRSKLIEILQVLSKVACPCWCLPRFPCTARTEVLKVIMLKGSAGLKKQDNKVKWILNSLTPQALHLFMPFK